MRRTALVGPILIASLLVCDQVAVAEPVPAPASTDAWLPTVIHAEQIDGTSGSGDFDTVYEVAADELGYYVVGARAAESPGVHGGVSSTFIAAHRPTGEARWTQQLGTELGSARSLVPVEGGVLVAGGTTGTLAAGDTPWADGWVRRYTDDGTTLWTTQFGNPDHPSSVADVAVDEDRIYAVGAVQGGDGASSSFRITVLDARTGAVLDRREWSSTQYDSLSAVAVIDGDPVVAGTSYGEVITDGGHSLGRYGVLMRLDATNLEPVWSALVNANAMGGPHSLESHGNRLYLAGEQGHGYVATLSAWDDSGRRLWFEGIGGAVYRGNPTSVAVTSRGLMFGGISTYFGAEPGTGDYATIVGLTFGGRPLWGIQFGTDHFEDLVTSVAASSWGMVAGGHTDGDLTDPEAPGVQYNGFVVALATYLPDLQVKGDGAWRDAGAQAVAQRATVRVRRGGAGVVRVRIANEGDGVDVFRVSGCTGVRDLATTVSEAGRDVTRRWRKGLWRTPPLQPGESAEVSLRFARPAGRPASVRMCSVTTASVADKRATDLADIRVGRPS